jgi:methylase of polypeptide subunit release factors
MSKHRTAYEIGRSQVATQKDIIQLFWRITHRYRSHFSSVLDLGAGDGRFSLSGHYTSYEGIEIDASKLPIAGLPRKATIAYNCVFEHQKKGYAACIGNPPYVRHHALEEKWRDSVAERLTQMTGFRINRKCNLYIYFMFLALLKARSDGLVSVLVPYEWVSRPSAESLRKYITSNKWHVGTYKFVEPIFNDVLTTASISVIDKRKRDGQWSYNLIDLNGDVTPLKSMTGSDCDIIP